MKSTHKGEHHVILVERGEKIVESVVAYCAAHKITCATLSGIGAVDSCELMHYVVDNKKYSSKTFTEPMEITALIGNISLMAGKPYAHCHITLGRKDFSTVGGHLKEATVHAVCEIVMHEVNIKISRQKDEPLGLNTWSI